MNPLTPRQRISYAIKLVLSHALYYGGILQLVVRVALRRKAVVLMYHRVLTSEQSRRTASQPGLIVEDTTFARHIEVLKRHFTILSLAEFEQRLLTGQPFDDRSCLITFDDGWIDNLQNALPILQSNGVPAVIFLPVNFIGQRRLFTREALTHLLIRAIEQGRRQAASVPRLREILTPLGFAHLVDVTDADPRAEVLAAVASHRYASGPAYETVVDQLLQELGIREDALSDDDTFIDWSQVAAMRTCGVAFGGHGADHRVLTHVERAIVQSEVERSKTVLDSRLGAPVGAFAYPGGGWNAEVAATVERCGYQIAFTIEPGHVRAGDHRFSLRRMNIHEGVTRTTPMFMARLAGLL